MLYLLLIKNENHKNKTETTFCMWRDLKFTTHSKRHLPLLCPDNDCTGYGSEWPDPESRKGGLDILHKGRRKLQSRGGRAYASKKPGPQTPAHIQATIHSQPPEAQLLAWFGWIFHAHSVCVGCYIWPLGPREIWQGSFRYSLISSSQQGTKCLELIYLISAFKEKLAPYIWDRVLLCSPDRSQNLWLFCLLYNTQLT